MMSSMASITSSSSSSSSATVRVDKATSEFLIGPDWTMNIDICDTVNSNTMLAKDVIKALKKRLLHKNPKVQLLALTLLEMMVKNCGDNVHFQIAERKILPEMVKIVKKKTDMHVRDKVLTLIGSWHDAFGGPTGRYPQYYMAYEDLRRSGVNFPQRSPDAAPIITPPVTYPAPTNHPQPGYGMPSSSSTRLDEAMAADQTLSLSSISAMRDIVDLLADMLQAVDPSDRSAIKDEVIVDLFEQCRANQRKLMQTLATTGDEELLGQGLDLNDSLQSVLAKHDAIASGSPLPPQVTNYKPEVPEKQDNSSQKSAEVSVPKASSSSSDNKPPPPVLPANKGVIDEEEEEEEDDFALLARRHTKVRNDVSRSNMAPTEAPSSPVMSNALVPINAPAPERAKDQDIIDLLSITLSTATTTEQTSQTPDSPMNATSHAHLPSASSRPTFSAEAHPAAFNNYVAPWAQPQPQPQPLPQQPTYSHTQPQQPTYSHTQPQQPTYSHTQPQHPTYSQTQQRPSYSQPQFPQYSSAYPPPPWAATPGYFTNQNPLSRASYAYSTPGPTSSSNQRLVQHEPINGDTQSNASPRSAATNAGQKPYIPTYRLFEDLDVFGNTDGRFKATNNGSPSFSGSNNQSMVGGRKW